MLIMKFGGTSVADAVAINRVIDIIRTTSCNEKKIILVVSAISDATNILSNLVEFAITGDICKCNSTIQLFHERHLILSKNLIFNDCKKSEADKIINNYFGEIHKIINKIFSSSECSDQLFAKIISYGELLSTAILNIAMSARLIKNILIDARNIILTDNNYLNGKPLIEEITKIMPNIIKQYLDQGYIVLTAGFIGSTITRETTVLGREGSDYSASLIGMVMKAREIQIWKDVDGIMTADPKKILNTKCIPLLSFNEALDLAYFGAKAIHPKTVEPALLGNIPIKILNSYKNIDNQKGTIINADITKDNSKLIFHSITYQENCLIISIKGNLKSYTDILHTLVSFNIHIISAMLVGDKLKIIILHNKFLKKIIKKFNISIIYEEEISLIAIIGQNLIHCNLIKDIVKILNHFEIKMILNNISHTSLVLIVDKINLFQIIQKLHDNLLV